MPAALPPASAVACPPKVTPSKAFPELLKKSFTLLLLVPVGFSVVVFELNEVLEVVVLDAVVCSTLAVSCSIFFACAI